MPLAYVSPEAFEVCIQCTEEQIQRHCDAAPENDRRDFDDQGGLQVPVYHVYKDNRADMPWPTGTRSTRPRVRDNEFDIRELPNWSEHPYGTSFDVLLQEALDRGLVRINNNQLTTVGGA